ncbi:STAS/SEC14 domain-containing protein [Sulfuriroseicoccus oceanibius]|uniref:STAS/SEC14 domain-containing protein n=1 Tax=Sulfuriroseicoccus oceanibius TaxID=2707525 RepID=A0A6B3L5N6_9BACT|nr:STAS/SEC14 domain-containing protein [Sulfuriroseicoccus oceanibius]QQL45146.1 hypothetical protein G3M56_000735 [Sulfuriroseicoccus oceanibius]
MPTELHYDAENDLMHTRAFGRVTKEDLLRHPSAQIEKLPQEGAHLYELLDARDVEGVDVSILGIVAHVPKMFSQLRHFDGVSLAILSNEDWVYGQANQLAALFARSSVRIRVFRVESQAMAWLDDQRAARNAVIEASARRAGGA